MRNFASTQHPYPRGAFTPVGKIALAALLTLALCAPLAAAEEEHEQILGFIIGMGVGLIAPSVRDLPEGLDDAGFLARLDIGLTVARVIGVKAVIGFSPFEWRLTEDRTVPMSHQLFTLDLFTEVDLGEKWRLWPAAGYTLDASITDTQGTGFLTARGVHAELGCGYRINSIMFAVLAVGYHFTEDFNEINFDYEEAGVDVGGDPAVSYLDVRAGVVFSLK